MTNDESPLMAWLQMQLARLTEISEANQAREQSTVEDLKKLGEKVDALREKIAKM